MRRAPSCITVSHHKAEETSIAKHILLGQIHGLNVLAKWYVFKCNDYNDAANLYTSNDGK